MTISSTIKFINKNKCVRNCICMYVCMHSWQLMQNIHIICKRQAAGDFHVNGYCQARLVQPALPNIATKFTSTKQVLLHSHQKLTCKDHERTRNAVKNLHRRSNKGFYWMLLPSPTSQQMTTACGKVSGGFMDVTTTSDNNNLRCLSWLCCWFRRHI